MSKKSSSHAEHPATPTKKSSKGGIPRPITVLGVAAVLFAVLFKSSLDFRYMACTLGAMGYLDFSPVLQDKLVKCIADSAMEYIARDFPKVKEQTFIPIHTFDCTKDFTWQKLVQETQQFTRPVLCKGLIANSPCRTKWSLEYFRSISTPNDVFVVQNFSAENLQGRPAFGQIKMPLANLTGYDTLTRMMNREPLFTSFDNVYFKNDHPELLDDMELGKFFPGVEWILNTLFMSGFNTTTLGSVFHAAPNENFFFQCRGRKHWYFVSPKDLHYTGAYINRGVIFTSLYVDEPTLIDHIPIYEGYVEEGDMLFNPSYWLHAVGTASGDNIAVANRIWMRSDMAERESHALSSIFRPFAFNSWQNSAFFDTLWYLQFPRFAASIAYQKLFWGKHLRMVQQIQDKSLEELTVKTNHSNAGRGLLRVKDTA